MSKILCTLLLFCIFDTQSHEFNPAHLVINKLENKEFNYEATWLSLIHI